MNATAHPSGLVRHYPEVLHAMTTKPHRPRRRYRMSQSEWAAYWERWRRMKEKERATKVREAKSMLEKNDAR